MRRKTQKSEMMRGIVPNAKKSDEVTIERLELSRSVRERYRYFIVAACYQEDGGTDFWIQSVSIR